MKTRPRKPRFLRKVGDVVQAGGGANGMTNFGGAMVQLFAATYPERVSGLILMGTYSNATKSIPSYREPKLAEAKILANWGTGASLPDFAPDLARDPDFLDWWARFERLSASPSAVIKLRQMNSEIDVTPILPSIQTPTLVIHRVGDVRTSIEHARDMAAAIPNSRMIELLGKDHFVWLEESGTVLTEIRNFVDTAQQSIEPERVLTTVLFTDVVDSTQRAAVLGDMEWRSILDAHFSLARSQLRRFRGREVKTLGDGILATFDGPARAVHCAQAIAAGVRPLGISIRAGLHTGEVEIRDDNDISGIAVNIASRVSHLAGNSEVLASSTVKDLVAGSGLIFHDLGFRAIKGLEDELRILSRFHRCFDNDAVLFLHHGCHLDFWREVGAVKHRNLFGVIGQCTRGRVLRSMAQCFGACIQSIGGFVCAATGVMGTRRHLLPRVGFGRRDFFSHSGILSARILSCSDNEGS